MKNVFKLSLSLLGNQFLASIGGFMCIIFVYMVAGDSIASQIIFLAITFPFFLYIEYRAAFTRGFHDPDRRNAPKSRAFVWRGALAGIISAVPLYVLIILYLVFYSSGAVASANLIKLFTRMISMYYNWPLCNIFPNHTPEVFLTSMVWVVIVPMLGYIAGYKNFMMSEKLYCLLKIRPRSK